MGADVAEVLVFVMSLFLHDFDVCYSPVSFCSIPLELNNFKGEFHTSEFLQLLSDNILTSFSLWGDSFAVYEILD